MSRPPETAMPYRRHRGVALIMVLLAMALIVLLATGMTRDQALRVYKASHYMTQQQGLGLALGVEELAQLFLKNDYEDDKEDGELFDARTEAWAANSQILPVDDITLVEAQIDDLGGRINLNNLIDQSGEVDQATRERLERLFQNYGIMSISVDAVVDWVDSNQEPTGATGAEDGQYLMKETPYRAANQPFASVTELLVLEGADRVSDEEKEALKSLLKNVTALPVSGVPVNVNMASAEVLSSLHDGITLQQAQSLIEKREEEPWKTVQDFLAEDELAGAGKGVPDLSVRTLFFEVVAKVSIDNRSSTLISTLYRSPSGEFQTIRRDMSQKNRITKPPFETEEE